MKRWLGAVGLICVLMLFALDGVVRAQVRPGHDAAPPPGSRRITGTPPSRDFRGRFGAEIASRLMRSTDPDDRIRGIERASSVRTPEGMALLERAAASPSAGGLDPRLPVEGIARMDPRALLAVVRGLATWSQEESARSALTSLLRDNMPRDALMGPAKSMAARPSTPGSGVTALPATGRPEDSGYDGRSAASRVLLARKMAALALARSGSSSAVDTLVATARTSGPGQEAAIDALASFPPSSATSIAASALTTPAMIALAASGGDLRAIDAIFSLAQTSQGPLRAASIAALGMAGDVRGDPIAHAALTDSDPHIRAAAASALVRLGAPEGQSAVETLIKDDATVLEGLGLAQLVQGEGVTKAAAARALTASDTTIRAAALAVLGLQTSPSAVEALEKLALDPVAGGDAACALAHSPSTEALAALESLSGRPPLRRLAARAYFVRRFTRGERSARLDTLLGDLASSNDPRDRAVGMQARVSLRAAPLREGLDDPSVGVRRAAAMSAVAIWNDDVRSAILARRRVEPDETTRSVLGIGLLDGDPHGAIPSSALLQLARAGGPDAPLAVMTLAARGGESASFSIDPFATSPDPVIRAHALSGLARSAVPDAPGRLAQMYAWEADAGVRRAIVAGLSSRTDRDAPWPRATLEGAAELDPDRVVRWVSTGTLTHRRFGLRSVRREVAWIQLVPALGAALPSDETAMLIQSDGSAIPIAFDEEGYALVPGVRSGDCRLRLAPRLPAYSLSIP